MKHLIVLLLLISINLSAQYFPTVEDQPVWTTAFGSSSGSGDAQITLEEVIDTCGNTWILFEEVSLLTGTSTGYFRQENQRYYYRQHISCDTKEYLMYDFSLEEGDSVVVGVPGTYFESNPNLDTLTVWAYEIDTLYYGGIPRRTLKMSFSPTVYSQAYVWIEGIGDSYHPFPPATCLTFTEHCEKSYYGNCLETEAGLIFVRNPFLENSCQYDIHHYFVNQGVQGGDSDGSSWEDAFVDLQQAIHLAKYGDTIWVAQGTYRPTSGDDRSQYVELKNGVAIFGGFNGTETSLDERNWEENTTILSGDIGVTQDSTDNSYHVLYALGVDSTTILDGFHIEGGYAVIENPNLDLKARGGAILMDVNADFPICSPQIKNCTFTNNVAIYGGAIYCKGDNDKYANPYLKNCYFFKNRGTFQGGAIFKEGANPSNNSQAIRQCTFTDNWAWQGGGAITMIDASGQYLFENCLFDRDTSFLEGGAILFISNSEAKLQFKQCIFEKNNALEGGAIMFIGTSGTVTDLNTYLEITDCRFSKNSARAAAGGAISLNSFDLSLNTSLHNTSFQENHCIERGGALFINLGSLSTSNLDVSSCEFKDNVGGANGGGAISIRGQSVTDGIQYSNTYIQNSLFQNNKGVFLLARGIGGTGYATFANCTFVNNEDHPIAKSWNNATSFEENDTRIELYNCIIWEPESVLPQIFLNGSFEEENLYGYKMANCLFHNNPCLVEGNEDACLTENLFEFDPEFVAPEEENFQIKACSPAINKGNNSYLAEVNTDLVGVPRILNDTIDIGAYEREAFHLTILPNISPETAIGASDGGISIEEVTGGTAPYTYWWDNEEDGTSVDQLSTGTYNLTITDAEGCSQSWTFVIDVLSAMPEMEGQTLCSLFPNPASENIFLEWKDDAMLDGQLFVLNGLGQVVKVVNLIAYQPNQIISIQDLPKGIYILQFKHQGQILANQQFIKQ